MQRRWDDTVKAFVIDQAGSEYYIGGAGQILAVTTAPADYSAGQDDYSIVADGTSNTVTITLPASPEKGRTYNISCLDSTFTVDIDFNGKNFYDSSANETLYQGENLTVQYDGTQWIGA